MEGSKVCSNYYHPPNKTSPPQMEIHIIHKYRYKKDMIVNNFEK